MIIEKLIEKIHRLKEERNAIILAHNYQLDEIQSIADFVGDSLELARKAKETKSDVIVFCGVDFMAETAAILNPDKIVLHPDTDAKCPMAAMITEEDMIALRKKYKNASFVCYINTSSNVKAYCDICCTSSNAVKVVNSLDNNNVVFVPDQYLASWVESKTNKKIIKFPGYCPTHLRITREHILHKKTLYPDAVVIAHPECRQDVIEVADFVTSTSGFIRISKEIPEKTIIVATEVGIVNRLRKEVQGKIFIPAYEEAICPRMKLITLEKVCTALENMKPIVKVNDKIAEKALLVIDRMLEIQ